MSSQKYVAFLSKAGDAAKGYQQISTCCCLQVRYSLFSCCSSYHAQPVQIQGLGVHQGYSRDSNSGQAACEQQTSSSGQAFFHAAKVRQQEWGCLTRGSLLSFPTSAPLARMCMPKGCPPLLILYLQVQLENHRSMGQEVQDGNSRISNSGQAVLVRQTSSAGQAFLGLVKVRQQEERGSAQGYFLPFPCCLLHARLRMLQGMLHPFPCLQMQSMGRRSNLGDVHRTLLAGHEEGDTTLAAAAAAAAAAARVTSVLSVTASIEAEELVQRRAEEVRGGGAAAGTSVHLLPRKSAGQHYGRGCSDLSSTWSWHDWSEAGSQQGECDGFHR